MEKEDMNGVMEVIMRDNFQMVWEREKVNGIIWMGLFMKDNLKKILNMAMEYKSINLVNIMKVSFERDKNLKELFTI